jgi:hypothetical protein
MLHILEKDDLSASYKLTILDLVKCAQIFFPFQLFLFRHFTITTVRNHFGDRFESRYQLGHSFSILKWARTKILFPIWFRFHFYIEATSLKIDLDRMLQLNWLENRLSSLGKVWATEHGKLLCSLSKYFCWVKRCEIVRSHCFVGQTHLLRNMQKILLCSFFQLLKMMFSNST